MFPRMESMWLAHRWIAQTSNTVCMLNLHNPNSVPILAQLQVQTFKQKLHKGGDGIWQCRGVGIGGRGPCPLSLQQVVVNKLLSLTTSLSAESDNAQLLQMLLVLERELTSGVRYLDNSNISLMVN